MAGSSMHPWMESPCCNALPPRNSHTQRGMLCLGPLAPSLTGPAQSLRQARGGATGPLYPAFLSSPSPVAIPRRVEARWPGHPAAPREQAHMVSGET